MYADAITIDKAKQSVSVPNPKETHINVQNSPQASQFNSWDEEGGRLDCKALGIPLFCNISPPLLLLLNIHHPVSARLISVFQEWTVSLPKARTALLVDESAR
jgi:hypothetical protein